MPDAPNSGSNRRSQPAGLGNQVKLLRTPTAVEAEGGLVHPEKARRENRTVRLGAQILEMTGDLLPTPVAQPSGNTPEDHLRKKPGRKQVTDLAIIVENDLLKTGGALLPTPNTMEHLPAREGEARERQLRRGGRTRRQSTGNLREDILEADTEWGKYEPAIHRWGAVLGREAPAPTQVSPRGKPQLAPAFVEWMMGLEKGWVTDPDIGLTRNEQLRMLGNGVVSQQAFAALELMEGL